MWILLLEQLTAAVSNCPRQHQPPTLELLFELLREVTKIPGLVPVNNTTHNHTAADTKTNPQSHLPTPQGLALPSSLSSSCFSLSCHCGYNEAMGTTRTGTSRRQTSSMPSDCPVNWWWNIFTASYIQVKLSTRKLQFM